MNINDKVYLVVYPYNVGRNRWNGLESAGIFLCDVVDIIQLNRINGEKIYEETQYQLKDVETGQEFYADEHHIFSAEKETREDIERIVFNTFMNDIKGYYNEIQLAYSNLIDAGIDMDKYMRDLKRENNEEK